MTIPNQIEGIGYRRLLGCTVKFILALVAAGLVIGLVARDSRDRALTGAVALAFSGLLFGFATSFLTREMRTLLVKVFVVVPVALTLVMFPMRTLFGWDKELPLALVLAPLAFTAGLILGQRSRR